MPRRGGSGMSRATRNHQTSQGEIMDWVNFREIRERISIERVIREYYQLDDLKVAGKTATCACPVHGGNNPRGFHIDFEKNLWHCFTQCKKGGNQLDLVAAKDNVPVREAALRLKRFFLDGDDGAPPPASPALAVPYPRTGPSGAVAATSERPARKKESPVNPPLTLSLQLLPDHPHILEDRKLSQATAEHFGIGYCARGILAGCIGIPIHDEAGQLVAYAGRRLKFADATDLGKYRFPKGFHKDRVLYNLHRALPAADGEYGLVIVEGFFTVMHLHQVGIRSAVAVMGSDLSEHQAVLVAKARHVTVLFDGDVAGRMGGVKAVDRLATLTNVHLVLVPDGSKPEDCTAELLRWQLAGVVSHHLTSLALQIAPLLPPAAAPPVVH